jgi:ribose transport system ATP-binding protein
MKAAAVEVFQEFGHDWIDPSKRVSQYDFSTRQTIEIIKAFALAKLLEIERPLLLLDEPTAGLSREETAFFFESIRDIAHRAGVVFVSHRLSEQLELSDRIYVFKDGEALAEADPAVYTEADLHFLMVGRMRDTALYQETMQRSACDKIALELRNLTLEPHFREVSLVVHSGEIAGLAGVVASGKSELARALFGDGKRPSGQIVVNGRVVQALSVRSMIAAGVGYVSPDRATDGIIPSAPVSWNMSLAALALADNRFILDLSAERDMSEDSVRRLGIKTRSIRTPIGRLSGGNQQKAILARWLEAGVATLVLDNPTKGIDVGAKQDVYRILREFVNDGGAILLISDDLVELIGLSNRVVAMKDGCVTAEVQAEPSAKPLESAILRHMV